MDDDDINAWTATLDKLTSSGKPLVAVAVGNSGELNAKERLNRIQPPSDAVNLLAVGACDSQTASWAKAAYSSVGPGRSPGIVKPDCVAFGGVENSPFYVINPLEPTLAKARMGTSFAAPFAIRTAIGIRAHLGPALGVLALKALLIHSCEEHQSSFSEVGFGRIRDDIEEIITCPPGVARVVYQGYLEPKRFLRAVIPVPSLPMPGDVTIAVTVCIATEVDSEHPMHYTRSGLEIFFRRDLANRPQGKTNPKSSTFFSSLRVNGLPLRPDAHEWETVRHASRRMRGASLRAPALDIHYNPRVSGHDAPMATTIPYAMVITLSAPRMPNLHDRILQRYRSQLEQLRPKISLPIRVQG
jgi:Subtilase family